ncbi:MAG: energy transducer TonB [Lentimicrobium sp.]|jgi:protein TonB|nr:energy transducer TonB [Lentimicrobium sp.]
MASKNKKAKNFIALPQYPGGQKALRKFITDNLRYPEDALKNKIEGDVFVTFQVSNEGKIEEVTVLKGLGYKCDEEAIRVIRLLQYEPAHNRGMKVRSNMRTSVRFRLPRQSTASIQYTTTSASSAPAEKQPGIVHHYTITLNSPGTQP